MFESYCKSVCTSDIKQQKMYIQDNVCMRVTQPLAVEKLVFLYHV